MKEKFLPLIILVTMLAVFWPQPAEAKITVTVINNRPYEVSVAFRWSGFDLPDDRRSGWYNVAPGRSRKIVFENAVYALTTEGFAYYAYGKSNDGKKTIYWSGKKSSDNSHFVIIHPHKAFKGHPRSPIAGGKDVLFRDMKITEIKDETRMNGKARLTFNP